MSQHIEWIPDSDWVFTPAQERSRKGLEKVLRSANELFIGQGYEATTITQISKASGVSVGSIYHRFNDKQGILLTVLESYRRNRYQQVHALVDPALWVGKTPKDVVGFHVEIVFSATTKDAAIYRLIERQRMVSADVNRQVAAWDDEICELFLGMYRTCCADVEEAVLRERVFFIHNVIRGAALWSTLGAGARHHYLDVESEQHRRKAVAMALLYLNSGVDMGLHHSSHTVAIK